MGVLCGVAHFAQRALLALARSEAPRDALQAKAMTAGQYVHILEHAQTASSAKGKHRTINEEKYIPREMRDFGASG